MVLVGGVYQAGFPTYFMIVVDERLCLISDSDSGPCGRVHHESLAVDISRFLSEKVEVS